MSEDDEAPGWDAIDAAIAPVVEGVPPLHWGTGTQLPDQGGLWGVSAYALADHWFFITYGLSELFTKVSDDPRVSGWGEELTFRLRRHDDEVPGWAVRLLARLGELVYQRGEPFLPGGRIEVPDVSEGAPPALAWTEDPVLEPFDGPFGAVQFVATVGLPSSTIAAMRSSSTADVLARIRDSNPLLIAQQSGLIW